MTSSSSGSLSTSDSTMDRLRGHQENAAFNIAASDSFQTPKTPNAELGTNVKNSHGPVSQASFAAVRAALADRGKAATKLKAVSLSLAADTTVANANYKKADDEADKSISGSMPST
ncbi:MAG: type VII secretion target [Mycobacterium sp.]|nr:type VII secretion target [Mycobacterium sp.]